MRMRMSPFFQLTSEIGFLCGRAPENEILFPEMPSVEEVSTEEGRVLGNVAHGDVEVAALLNRRLNKIYLF